MGPSLFLITEIKRGWGGVGWGEGGRISAQWESVHDGCFYIELNFVSYIRAQVTSFQTCCRISCVKSNLLMTISDIEALVFNMYLLGELHKGPSVIFSEMNNKCFGGIGIGLCHISFGKSNLNWNSKLGDSIFRYWGFHLQCVLGELQRAQVEFSEMVLRLNFHQDGKSELIEIVSLNSIWTKFYLQFDTSLYLASSWRAQVWHIFRNENDTWSNYKLDWRNNSMEKKLPSRPCIQKVALSNWSLALNLVSSIRARVFYFQK